MEINSSESVILKMLEILHYLCPFLIGSSFLLGSYTTSQASRRRLNGVHYRYILLWLMLGVVLSYVGSFQAVTVILLTDFQLVEVVISIRGSVAQYDWLMSLHKIVSLSLPNSSSS
jgi:hypothetical protein